MTSTPRRYRGISAEDRQSTRRRQLLDAGLEIVGTRGVERATMTAICAQAGLTERYFYESFSARQAFLLEDAFKAMSHHVDSANLLNDQLLDRFDEVCKPGSRGQRNGRRRTVSDSAGVADHVGDQLNAGDRPVVAGTESCRPTLGSTQHAYAG